MMAFCTRCEGSASGFAPASMSTQCLPSEGMMLAIAGRSTPGSVRSLMSEAVTAAPVCPALTTACAFPSFTKSTAREMELSFFRRTASSPLSAISTTCVVWMISMRPSLQPCFFSSASMRGVSPVRNIFVICGYSPSARTAPWMIFSGAWSPPIASSAIFIVKNGPQSVGARLNVSKQKIGRGGFGLSQACLSALPSAP